MNETLIEQIEALRQKRREAPFPKNRIFADAAIQCLGGAVAHLKSDDAQLEREANEGKARVEEARRIVAEAEAQKPAN